jgi:hypothetical protein
LGTNALSCCDRYNWSRDLFRGNNDLSNNYFVSAAKGYSSEYDGSVALFLLESRCIREGLNNVICHLAIAKVLVPENFSLLVCILLVPLFDYIVKSNNDNNSEILICIQHILR